MALIKHANAKDLTRDAVVLDLGDLHRQGELLIESAKRRAADIVKQAEAERERLIAGAAEKGHAEGLARGLEEGRARGQEQGRAEAAEAVRQELDALRAGWEAALAGFTADRDRMLLEARDEILRLALRIAEKVTKRRIETDPAGAGGVAAAQLEAVLALITRPTSLVIAVHPDDRAAIEHALPSLLATLTAAPRHIELIDDPALPRGSCIARTRGGDDSSGGAGGGGGEINASIDLQLQRIAEALLPTHTEETPA